MSNDEGSTSADAPLLAPPSSRRASRGQRGRGDGPEARAPRRGWYTRHYLPHFDDGDSAQLVTFRLADSFPHEQLAAWRDELARLPEQDATRERLRRIEAYLDKGLGSAWLRDPRIAGLVQEALLSFDGDRYRLHAWVIMPNHVHVLFMLPGSHGLSSVLHSWKSYTAKKANALLGRSGRFWQEDYFDRYIRNERHFAAAIAYVEDNPVRAGLCAQSTEWRFSSAWRGHRERV